MGSRVLLRDGAGSWGSRMMRGHVGLPIQSNLWDAGDELPFFPRKDLGVLRAEKDLLKIRFEAGVVCENPLRDHGTEGGETLFVCGHLGEDAGL